MIQNGINYQQLVEAMPGLHVLMTAEEEPVVLATTIEYASAIHQNSKSTHKSFFNLFNHLDGTEQTVWETTMQASINKVMGQKAAHHFNAHLNLFSTKEMNDGVYEVTNQPITNEKGEIKYILHSISIDNKKSEAEKKELASTAVFSSSFQLFQQAPVAICIVKGADYTVELANEGMLQFLGRTAEMVGKPIIESLPEAKLQGLIGILEKVRTTGQPVHIENFAASIIIEGQREEHFFDLVFKPVFEKEGDAVPNRIFCVAHNITSQKRDQLQIAESEEKYRTLFTGMDQGFCILEMIFDADNNPVDYTFLEINPVFEKQTGLVDAVGKTARQLVPTWKHIGTSYMARWH